MKPVVLTVTLNPAVDKTVFVPDFGIGRDFREESVFLSAGGKGINVSRVLKELGVGALATGFLGGPDGRYIEEGLAEEDIGQEFCAIQDRTRTSLTVIDPAKGTVTRVLERGPRIGSGELDIFRKRFLVLLRSCRYIVLSGSSAPGIPGSFYGELIEMSRNRGVMTILDTSGKALEMGLKKKPYMIKPNLKEAEQLSGRKIRSISDAKSAARCFYRAGIKIAAVTMGSQGAVIFDGKEMFLGVPPRTKIQSLVGCGDAFIAGFIASQVKNRSFKESFRAAVACGAANTQSVNPGFIKRSHVGKIIKCVRIKSLGC